jgi:2-polyprenyl-3-methyl-5-hydroxy-6-metoxy-1,4-benzoquinol methylase
VGLEPDPESIRQAREAAAKEGLQHRIQFVARSTRDLDRGDGFDLITACDCVHDFSAPHRTLGELRALLKPEGTLFVVEPRLEDNLHPIAAMYYGFSLFHCLGQLQWQRST